MKFSAYLPSNAFLVFLLFGAIAASVAIYWPGLDAYALGDDALILQTPIVERAFANSLHGDWFGRPPSSTSARFYRPGVTIPTWIEYNIFGQWVAGYHLMQIIVHALCSWLITLLFWQIGREEKWKYAGLVAGFLFLMHPRHCEAVIPICSRSDIFAALWLLICANVHVFSWRQKGIRKILLLLLAVIFYIFSLCSKEIALAGPALIFLLEILLGSLPDDRIWTRLRLVAIRIFPYALIAGLFLPLRYAFTGQLLGTASYVGGIPEFERIVASLIKVLLALIFVVPFDLTSIWDFMRDGIYSYKLILFLAVITAIFFYLAIVNKNSPIRRFAAVGWGCWFLLYLPAANVGAAMKTTRWDHNMYMASIGMAIFFGAMAGASIWHRKPGMKILAALLLCLYGCVATYALRSEARQWQIYGKYAKTCVGVIESKLQETEPGTSIVLLATPYIARSHDIPILSSTFSYVRFLGYADRKLDLHYIAAAEVHDTQAFSTSWETEDGIHLSGTVENGLFLKPHPHLDPNIAAVKPMNSSQFAEVTLVANPQAVYLYPAGGTLQRLELDCPPTP